jgi:hypothetical protein
VSHSSINSNPNSNKVAIDKSKSNSNEVTNGRGATGFGTTGYINSGHSFMINEDDDTDCLNQTTE